MFQPLNSSESSKTLLRTARGIKAAALQAGSRQARCLIIVEVSACYRCVERGARLILRVSAWFVDNAALSVQCWVSSILPTWIWQESKGHPLCRVWSLGKGPLPLFPGCTPPRRVLCSGFVPLPPDCCAPRKLVFKAFAWKDADSSWSLLGSMQRSRYGRGLVCAFFINERQRVGWVAVPKEMQTFC